MFAVPALLMGTQLYPNCLYPFHMILVQWLHLSVTFDAVCATVKANTAEQQISRSLEGRKLLCSWNFSEYEDETNYI